MSKRKKLTYGVGVCDVDEPVHPLNTEQAHAAYRNAKLEYCIEVAEEHKGIVPNRTVEAIIRQAYLRYGDKDTAA